MSWVILNSVISWNTAIGNGANPQRAGTPGGGSGGGIYNAGTLTLVGSSVFDNTANVDGGGIYNAGVLYRCGGAEVYDNEAPAGTDNDISGTPAQACPTAPDPEGPEQEEPDLVPTGGPSDVLLGTAIVVLLAGALALLAGRRRTA